MRAWIGVLVLCSIGCGNPRPPGQMQPPGPDLRMAPSDLTYVPPDLAIVEDLAMAQEPDLRKRPVCANPMSKECEQCYTAALDPGGACEKPFTECLDDIDCSDLFDCLTGCGPDMGCAQKCYDGTPQRAKVLLSNFVGCLEMACPRS